MLPMHGGYGRSSYGWVKGKSSRSCCTRVGGLLMEGDAIPYPIVLAGDKDAVFLFVRPCLEC